MERTEVLVVGAGPIGLELGAALKRRGIGYIQVEAGQIGSTLEWWAPGTRFFSSPERIEIAGVPLVTRGEEKATREEYLAYLRGVVEQFDLEVRTGERVEGIERAGASEGFVVAARRGGERREYRARRVVLAIGDLHRPRLLGVPGEGLAHVSHYFQEPHTYFRRRVLIVGGRNSAVEAAIRCHRVGTRVAMSYRGAAFDRERIKYWLLPEVEWLIHKGKIEFFGGTLVERITERSVELCGVEGLGAGRSVAAQRVLLLTGYEQDPALFESVGVRLEGENRAPAHNPRTMETNIAGLYVAGTAAAGTQRRFRVFIETSHVHVDRIVAAIAGEEPPREEGELEAGEAEQ